MTLLQCDSLSDVEGVRSLLNTQLAHLAISSSSSERASIP